MLIPPVVERFLWGSTVWLIGIPNTTPSPVLVFASEKYFIIRKIFWMKYFLDVNINVMIILSMESRLGSNLTLTSCYTLILISKVVQIENIPNSTLKFESRTFDSSFPHIFLLGLKDIFRKAKMWYHQRIWWCCDFGKFLRSVYECSADWLHFI